MKLFFLTAALCYQNALFYNAPHCTDTGFEIRPAMPHIALQELDKGLKEGENDPLFFPLLRERALTYERLGEGKKAEIDWMLLAKEAPPGDIKEEALFQVASSLSKRQDKEAAHHALEKMRAYYNASLITRGAYLARFYQLEATLYQEEGDLTQALLLFAQAEEAARGHTLPPDEQLSLWIAYAHALKQAGQYEQAKEWLTRASKEEVISHQRLLAKQHLDQLQQEMQPQEVQQ